MATPSGDISTGEPPPLGSLSSVVDMVDQFLVVFLVAFVISYIATPLMRVIATRFGVVDKPDLERKLHALPVAYLGGVAIFAGWIGGMMLVWFMSAEGANAVEQLMHARRMFPWSIVLGGVVIVVLGVIDDVHGISPQIKLGGQFVAAACIANQTAFVERGDEIEAMMLGQKLVLDTVALAGLGMSDLVAYIVGTFVIALFVTGGCNAMNLIDGLDGLAAGVSSIATLGFLFIAAAVAVLAFTPGSELADSNFAYNPVRIVLCMALLGGLLGFLPYNFNPATIFMGDAGSMLLGYLSISIILQFEHVGNRGPMFVMAGLIVFAVPVMDTALSIVRRKMTGKPIFHADDQHLHHQFLHGYRRAGLGPAMSVKLAVVSMYAIAMLFAIVGSSMVFLRFRYVIAVFVVVFGSIAAVAYKAASQRAALQNQQLKETAEASGGVASARGGTEEAAEDSPANELKSSQIGGSVNGVHQG